MKKTLNDKNPHAVALGRLGGLVGGRRRAQVLTPDRRREIALAGATASWSEAARARRAENGRKRRKVKDTA